MGKSFSTSIAVAAINTAMCAVVVASPPASQPSTQPLDALTADQRAMDAARNACLDRLHTNPAFVMAVANRDDKLAALVKARAGDDPQAKLDASGAFNKARSNVSDMERAALAGDSTFLQAEATYTAEFAASTARANADAQAAAASARAVEADRVAKRVRDGMTLEDVKAMWGEPDSQTTDGTGETTATWTIKKYDPAVDRGPPDEFEGQQVDVRMIDVSGPKYTQAEMDKTWGHPCRRLTVLVVDGKVKNFEDTVLAPK